MENTLQNHIDQSDFDFNLQLFAEGDAGTPPVTPPTGTDTPPAGTGIPPATPPVGDAGTPPAAPPKPAGDGNKQTSLLNGQQGTTAPEHYEDFKLLDNYKWDNAIGGEFKNVAKGMGLSQENAQKLVDLGVKMAGNQESAMEQMMVDQSNQWAEQSKAQFNQEGLDVANKAIAQFATPEFKALLQDTGLGNNPVVIGVFNSIGKAMAEGTMPGSQAQAAAQHIYGKSPEMYEK